MVFQNYNLFKNKTILENITVGLKYGKNYSHAEANDIALSYLNRIDLLEQKINIRVNYLVGKVNVSESFVHLP